MVGMDGAAREQQQRRERAEARRARMTIVRTPEGAGAPDPVPVQGAEAISLVTQLTRESWSLAGLPLPSYERSAIPFRFAPGRLT